MGYFIRRNSVDSDYGMETSIRRRAGRPRGAKNKRTQERERAAIAAAEKISSVLGQDAFEGDAHALCMAIYKDCKQPIQLRLQAAQAALPYEKPKLSSIDASVSGQVTVERALLALEAASEQYAQGRDL
jgi:hypothetical protein